MNFMLPIYNESYRPSSSWVKELALKRDALQQLEPIDPSLEAKIQDHLLVEQVAQNLSLGDIAISTERARSLISGAQAVEETADRAALSFANAARYLHSLFVDKESKVQSFLTSDLLCELHTLAMEGVGERGGFYRDSEAKPMAPGHEPAPAEVLPRLIENALDWFSVESFAELHPIEQAWLVHLRLLDLQPFSSANGRIARLAAGFYTLRVGLPPIIVKAEDRELYNHAVINAFQMVTQPGIELFARSLICTIDEIIAISRTADSSIDE
jgi:Fic family protein